MSNLEDEKPLVNPDWAIGMSLDSLSVDELALYKNALEAEIERVLREKERKIDVRRSAERLFSGKGT